MPNVHPFFLKKPFRVRVFDSWPVDEYTTVEDKYFEYFDGAQVFYLKAIMDQVLETRLIERISFERFNKYTGQYHEMFDSFCHQTVESHGLNPNV